MDGWHHPPTRDVAHAVRNFPAHELFPEPSPGRREGEPYAEGKRFAIYPKPPPQPTKASEGKPSGAFAFFGLSRHRRELCGNCAAATSGGNLSNQGHSR